MGAVPKKTFQANLDYPDFEYRNIFHLMNKFNGAAENPNPITIKPTGTVSSEDVYKWINLVSLDGLDLAEILIIADVNHYNPDDVIIHHEGCPRRDKDTPEIKCRTLNEHVQKLAVVARNYQCLSGVVKNIEDWYKADKIEVQALADIKKQLDIFFSNYVLWVTTIENLIQEYQAIPGQGNGTGEPTYDVDVEEVLEGFEDILN